MWTRFFRIFSTILPAFLWLMLPTVAQNITNLKVESVSCSSVNASAKINPVSATYTFAWVVSSSDGLDIDIVLVGLDGEGNIGTIDQGSQFNYSIENIPKVLPNRNDPFRSILIFNFGDNESNADLVFRIVSFPLNIRISDSVSKPRCPLTVQNFRVFCTDNSQDCFLCKSNLIAYITCPNNEVLNATCNENATFSFDNCLTESQQSSTTNLLPQSTIEQRETGTSDMTTIETMQKTPITIKDNTISDKVVTTTISPVTTTDHSQVNKCFGISSPYLKIQCNWLFCYLFCLPGYTLDGPNVICNYLELSITSITSKCCISSAYEIRCPELKKSNYIGTCTNENRVGSVCRLGCHPGKHLSSTPEVKCLNNGCWNPPLDVVEDCRSDNIRFSICFGISFPYLRYHCNHSGWFCYLSCPRGYTLVGPRRISIYTGVPITSQCCLKEAHEYYSFYY